MSKLNVALLQLAETEGLTIAQFDLDCIRDWRATKHWGDAFRRPSAYPRLVDPVAAPFIRKDTCGGELTQRWHG